MATVCEAHRPSLPGEGRAANVADALRAPHPAQPPSPAAKPNTDMSETALLSHRTGPTTAENTLQKINSPGPKKSKYLINLRTASKRMNVQRWWRRARRGGQQGWLEMKGATIV
ncbi:hypothetical protein ABVT39_004037 [Epinephelus coioides]